MQTKTIEKTRYNEEDDITEVIGTYELAYDEDHKVLEVTKVIPGDEKKQSLISQPYKTNPDGTTQEWQSAEDAFDWFENREDIL